MKSKFALIEVKVEPKSGTDLGAYSVALTSYCDNDPNLTCRIDVDTGAATIGGMSDEHLDCMFGDLKMQGLDLEVSPPQICYRETIQRKAKIDYTHKKLLFGTGQFARVIMEVEPNERDKGNQFDNKAPESSIPRHFLQGIDKGLNSVMDAGVMINAPVVDIRITLIDGAFHDRDSSPLTFEIASRAALRSGLDSAGPLLLQPMMQIEVTTPDRYLGQLIGDLNRRTGIIVGTAQQDDNCVVEAIVPLANLLGYTHDLNLLSEGHGSFKMKYDHYAAVPAGSDGPENFPPALAMRA
jgi:elongation factor G